jgi:hypothetical protein
MESRVSQEQSWKRLLTIWAIQLGARGEALDFDTSEWFDREPEFIFELTEEGQFYIQIMA